VLRLPILVDTDEVSGAMPAAFRANPFVLFACPAGRSRLFRLVAEAMQRVWEEGLKCDLVIVGPSLHDQRNRWLADIKGHSIHGSISWLGRVPRSDLLALYREARGLLVPLEVEPNSEARFPTKLGEYLASGTPVVATSLGELPHLLTDGETAYLAGPESAYIFGQRIADLLRDPVAAREVGRRGRELAISEFDYRQHAETLRDWFAALIEKGRTP
jgi:glycosyltransferase involved in cell wall biosynthesis